MNANVHNISSEIKDEEYKDILNKKNHTVAYKQEIGVYHGNIKN